MKNKSLYISFSFIIALGLAGLACEGPTGSDGPQGQQGEQGPPGPVGPAGADGTQMLAGQGAPDNDMGEPGDYFLDLENGVLYGPKTEDGWGSPVSLGGTEGPQGPQGPQGEQGPQGPAGNDGKDGQDGKDGKDGSQIFAGDGEPDPGQGKKGDYFLDTKNFLLYGPKTSDGWGAPINLKGPDGPEGPQGPQGEQGPQGPEGPQGPQGPAGEDGQDGNANVTLYILNGHTFTGDNFSAERCISLEDEDSMLQSAWLVYLVHGAGNIYHIPGTGEQGIPFEVSHSWDDGQACFNIVRTDSGDDETYANIHIIRVEASNVVSKQMQPHVLIPDSLDVTDYHSVVKYFGME